MHVPPLTWITRALWVLLPVTLGGPIGTLAAHVAGAGSTGAGAIAVGAWLVWATGLFASFVMLPVALTVLRIVAPVPVVAGAVAAAVEAPDAVGWIGVALAAAVAVTAMSAVVGDAFVNGSAYGDERRVALRPPAALLFGPIELTWALTALPLPAAVLLAAAGRWVLAVVVAVLGAAAAVVGARALDRLTRRWLVFVPAGVTIVDHMTLAEPILLRRTAVVRLGPATADTTALDLTAGAGGLILQVDLSEPVELARATPTRRSEPEEPIETSSLLVAPSRPGELLAHAESRRIAVARG